MDYGLYLSTAGALVQDVRVDQVANNLANGDTYGFHRVLQSIQSRRPESQEDPTDHIWGQKILDKVGGGTLMHHTLYDRSGGATIITGNPLDFAIQGGGYFAVRPTGEPEGEVAFTRAGNFRHDPDGILRTADGAYELLDRSNKSILVADLANDNLALRVQIQSFDPAARVRAIGGARYQFDQPGTQVSAPGRLVQGALERSTVTVVTEMVQMISALRAYEANASMIRTQNETLGRAVNEIARQPR